MEKDHSEVLRNLTTFFSDKVDLRKFTAKMKALSLLDEDLIPSPCSNQEWVGHVLEQVRRSGPQAYSHFRDIFEGYEWIQQKMDEELRAITTDIGQPRPNLQRTLSVSLALKGPVEHYVERTTLEEKCLKHLIDHHCIALTGINGNGKTQLARRLAQELHKQCDSGSAGIAVEIDCSTAETCMESWRKLQNYTDIPVCNLNQSHLRSLLKHLDQGDNILIFDNVSTDMSWLQSVKPPSKTFIIITTVDDKLFNGVSVPVCGLNDDEAETLSKSLMRTSISMEDIKELAREMDANALGLTIAFKHLEISKTSVETYIKRLQQGIFPQLTDLKGPDEDYPKTLKTALAMSLSQIDIQLTKEGYPDVFRALAVCAYLNKYDIPLEYIGPIFQYARPGTLCNGQSVGDKPVDGHCIVDNLVAKIRSHSLGEVMQRGSHRVLNLHRAVQIALLEYLTQKGLYDDALTNALLLMTHLCNKDTRFQFEDQLNMVCHVEAVLRHVKPRHNNTLIDVLHVWLLITVGHIYTQMKQPAQADKYLKAALDLIETNILDGRIRLHKSTEGSLLDVQEICNDVEQQLQTKANSEEVLQDLQTFIFSQRLTQKDVNNWKEKDPDIEHLFEDNPGVVKGDMWMSEEIYKKLTKHGCTADIGKVRCFALQELLVSALYTYGRVYFYQKTLETPEALAKEKPDRRRTLMLADCLCKAIEKTYEVKLLHSELVLSNALYYFDIDDGKFPESISNYMKLLTSPCEKFELGLLKSDDKYRSLMLYRQLIACYKKLFEANYIISDREVADAQKCIRSLESLLAESTVQAHSEASYYNEIGGLHLVMHGQENAREAFKHACEIERQSAMINYPWMDAIKGLFKLFESGNIEKDEIDNEIQAYKEHVEECIKKHPHHDYGKEIDRVNELIGLIEETKGLSRLHSSADNLRKLVKSISLDADPITESTAEADEDDVFVDSSTITTAEPSSKIYINRHED